MISQRIKKLRQTLHMTQTEFSKALGLTQGHMTSIENGKRNITERTVMSICRTYNVSEEWLREGKGEMFTVSGKNNLKQLAKDYHLSEQEQLLLTSFLEMPAKQRKICTKFLVSWAEAMMKTEKDDSKKEVM